jgi:parallel beta-helix repeat protein
MKTLQQIEPRIDVATLSGSGPSLHQISSPGSYYLSENITITDPSGWGIYITAPDVTLDLNGFRIFSNSSSTYGIFLHANAYNCTIKNGAITGVDYGVGEQAGTNSTSLENLRIVALHTGLNLANSSTVIGCQVTAYDSNSVQGIVVDESALIKNCSVDGFQSSYGILATKGTTVVDTIVTNCLNGISGTYGVLIQGCTVSNNLSVGINSTVADVLIKDCEVVNNGATGINISTNSTDAACEIIDCNVSDNGGVGISLNTTIVKLDNCNVANNTGNGIYSVNGATISNCTVTNNTGQYAIRSGAFSRIENCHLRDNIWSQASTNANYGIYVLDGSTVTGCTVSGTGSAQSPSVGTNGIGIYGNRKVRILNCEVSFCQGDAIRVSQSCHIEGNLCISNGGRTVQTRDGAGIHSTSFDNVIDGNTVYDNSRGIDVDTSNNLIIRNLARTNGINYDIASGNRQGVIVVAPTSPATSGSSGGSGVGTSNPFANISY